jgi:hypothetical protein
MNHLPHPHQKSPSQADPINLIVISPANAPHSRRVLQESWMN